MAKTLVFDLLEMLHYQYPLVHAEQWVDAIPVTQTGAEELPANQERSKLSRWPYVS